MDGFYLVLGGMFLSALIFRWLFLGSLKKILFFVLITGIWLRMDKPEWFMDLIEKANSIL